MSPFVMSHVKQAVPPFLGMYFPVVYNSSHIVMTTEVSGSIPDTAIFFLFFLPNLQEVQLTAPVVCATNPIGQSRQDTQPRPSSSVALSCDIIIGSCAGHVTYLQCVPSGHF